MDQSGLVLSPGLALFSLRDVRVPFGSDALPPAISEPTIFEIKKM